MNTANEVLDLALRLPEHERAAIARQLLLSLEPDQFDEDHEAAWLAEIEARRGRLERGETTARD